MSRWDARGTRTEPRCGLERSSRATELFVRHLRYDSPRVELFSRASEWVRGRNARARRSGEPGACQRGTGDKRRRGERKREKGASVREQEGRREGEELRVWVGRDAWRARLSCGANRYCDIFDRIYSYDAPSYFFPLFSLLFSRPC